jgi:hypothetical protein
MQGARHVIPMEGDVGTCELPLRVRLHAENVTWLQFWGLYDFHPSWSHIFHNRIPCHVPGRVGWGKQRNSGRAVKAEHESTGGGGEQQAVPAFEPPHSSGRHIKSAAQQTWAHTSLVPPVAT